MSAPFPRPAEPGPPGPPPIGRPRVLICPDSFKGTYSARAVADALAAGVRQAGGTPVCLPLADGGEGTAEVLLELLGGRWLDADVTDAVGRRRTAGFALLADGRTAVVDVAAASGLTIVPEAERNAETASSYGTGELISVAVRAGARRVLVACGGSATTDGGEGALRAIASAGGLRGTELVVLCDVRTVFERAAEVFAPQKGADAASVIRLTARLHRLAASWPRDPRGVPYTGAAGGLSGGLWGVLGASLTSGIDAVLDAAGFEDHLAGADVIITGEGRLDSQSAEGKVISGVLSRAGAVPVHVTAGQVTLLDEDLAALGVTQAHVTPTAREMTAAAAAIAARYAAPPAGTR